MEEPLQNHSDATAAEEVDDGLPTPLASCRLGLAALCSLAQPGTSPQMGSGEHMPQQRSCTTSLCCCLHWTQLLPFLL